MVVFQMVFTILMYSVLWVFGDVGVEIEVEIVDSAWVLLALFVQE